MTRRPHTARQLGVKSTALGFTPVLVLFLAPALSGCRHKATVYQLPASVHAPIELEEPPPPDSPPMVASLPPPQLEDLPPLPVPPPAPRKRPATAPKEAQTPVQVAGASAPAALAIGELSAGGDSTPQIQQQAKDLIAAILRRIAALPARTADAQKRQIRQVRHFLDQAQQALNSGDADGAKNLATKARLLMDDLEKR